MRRRNFLTAVGVGALGGALLPSCIAPDDDPHSTGAALFNVLDFGAAGDGITDDFAAISAAAVAAAAHARATLYFPEGRYFTSRAVRLVSSETSLIGDGVDFSHFLSNDEFVVTCAAVQQLSLADLSIAAADSRAPSLAGERGIELGSTRAIRLTNMNFLRGTERVSQIVGSVEAQIS